MDLSIPERIKREKARILKIYVALDPDRLEVAKGLGGWDVIKHNNKPNTPDSAPQKYLAKV